LLVLIPGRSLFSLLLLVLFLFLGQALFFSIVLLCLDVGILNEDFIRLLQVDHVTITQEEALLIDLVLGPEVNRLFFVTDRESYSVFTRVLVVRALKIGYVII